jgi:hypothetical protein
VGVLRGAALPAVTLQGDPFGADHDHVETTERTEVPCDREHLNELRAPSSDVAVPSNPAALESIARLLSHQRPPTP